MLGTLIGAGLGVASKIFGGISAAKARRKQERMLAQQEQENQAWYDRKYNEDPTKRADTVKLLTQMQEQIKNRNKAARGRQAVMGGTEDSTTAVKEANNKTLADTTSQIVAANESRKDAIEGQYQARKDAIQNKRMGLEAEKANDVASVASGIAGTAANIAATIDGGLGNSKVARPSVSSPTQVDMDKLDAKVGAAPTQQQVASDLNDMIGDNAPKKVNV